MFVMQPSNKYRENVILAKQPSIHNQHKGTANANFEGSTLRAEVALPLMLCQEVGEVYLEHFCKINVTRFIRLLWSARASKVSP
jgi:hypothetical protein